MNIFTKSKAACMARIVQLKCMLPTTDMPLALLMGALTLLPLTSAGSAPILAQSGIVERYDGDPNSCFTWNEVPVDQDVPVTRCTFDQGGYQIYDTAGETIVVPFSHHDLYAMKFCVSDNGQMYFVNNGYCPILYLPQGDYVENAYDPGAHWYPFTDEWHPNSPVYVGIAPSWGAFIGMGWYPDEACYGGYWCSGPYADGVAVFASFGFGFYIGSTYCHGWWPFYHYCSYHHPWFHTRYWNNAVYQYAARPVVGRPGFGSMMYARPFGRSAAWGERTFSGRYMTARRDPSMFHGRSSVPNRAFGGGRFAAAAGRGTFGGRNATGARRTFGGRNTMTAQQMNVQRRMQAHRANLARTAAAHQANVARAAAHRANMARTYANHSRMAAHRANVARNQAMHRLNAARNQQTTHRMNVARNQQAMHRANVARNQATRRMNVARNQAMHRSEPFAHRTASAHQLRGTVARGDHQFQGARNFGGARQVHAAPNFGRARQVYAGRNFGGGRSFQGARNFGGGARSYHAPRSFGGGGGGQIFAHRALGGGAPRSFGGGPRFSGGGAPRAGGGAPRGGGGGDHRHH